MLVIHQTKLCAVFIKRRKPAGTIEADSYNVNLHKRDRSPCLIEMILTFKKWKNPDKISAATATLLTKFSPTKKY